MRIPKDQQTHDPQMEATRNNSARKNWKQYPLQIIRPNKKNTLTIITMKTKTDEKKDRISARQKNVEKFIKGGQTQCHRHYN